MRQQQQQYNLIPDSPKDTLMACFSLFLTGKETRTERTKLRMRLMDHLYHLLFRDNQRLNEECFLHASVRAMVNRLHAIHPDQVPRSAEVFYIRDEERFKREALAFVMQNRREGFVGDMFTFSYLVAELFAVDVHLFHLEETTLSVVAFAKYHVYVRYNDGKFNLMLPRLQQAHFMRPMGITKMPSRTSLPMFHLNDNKPFIPPNILDYRVHHLCLYDTGLHAIEPIRTSWPKMLRDHEYAYVVSKMVTTSALRVISCVSASGQCGPRFYVDVVPIQLYVIIEANMDEALKAVRIERTY